MNHRRRRSRTSLRSSPLAVRRRSLTGCRAEAESYPIYLASVADQRIPCSYPFLSRVNSSLCPLSLSVSLSLSSFSHDPPYHRLTVDGIADLTLRWLNEQRAFPPRFVNRTIRICDSVSRVLIDQPLPKETPQRVSQGPFLFCPAYLF